MVQPLTTDSTQQTGREKKPGSMGTLEVFPGLCLFPSHPFKGLRVVLGGGGGGGDLAVSQQVLHEYAVTKLI